MKERVILYQQQLQKCTELGQKYFDDNYHQYKWDNPLVWLDGPYFQYNKKSKNCFLMFHITSFANKNDAEIVIENYRRDTAIINLYSGVKYYISVLTKNGTFATDKDMAEWNRFFDLTETLFRK